ncbi:MAG: methyltransferase domain-containing protein [Solirubrobacterales bacterium]|nr:methyltransferase domain-containing protein [Solirubrobacterales bacterium]
MRLIQHKAEAWWFYRVVSKVYDRWVNPLFWTPRMRDEALELARLDAPGLRVLDAGAGTGFTTEGIVARVPAGQVVMVDQSPHQLARARRKPALAACEVREGDAEDLPFGDDAFDRYVSAGSIEYWPDPQRGIAEAYRVVREGGTALVVGPVRPAQALARRLADTWMLFPSEEEYRAWFAAAGFADVEVRRLAPDWYDEASGAAYGVAVAGRKPAPGPSPLGLAPPAERLGEPMGLRRRLLFAGRFAVGSLAGLAFVPVALLQTLRARRAR